MMGFLGSPGECVCEEAAVSELPYELDFMHKYNLHKLLGLPIEDDDLPVTARLYGVSLKELESIDRRYRENIARLAGKLAEKRPLQHAPAPLTVLAIGDSITSDRESYVKILAQYWAGPGGSGAPTRNGTSEVPLRRMLDGGISGDTACVDNDRLKRVLPGGQLGLRYPL
jgi:hypothetical protein